MVANAIQIVLNEDEQRRINAVKSLANIVYTLRYEVFQPGVDYGVIPGTGDKPTLWLPGMEKLLIALRLRAEYHAVSIIEDYDKGLFVYRYECRLIEYETGLCIATAIGSCNSKESKYRWREQKRKCPTCGKDTIIKGKEEYGGGWLCWKKEGKSDGCGAKFAVADTAITSQPIGRIENPDIFDQVNTIDKIGQKRALSSAVKSAANVSEYFTVDLDDLSTYRVDLPDDVIEGEIVETVVQPTLQQPATNSKAPTSQETRALNWTTIYTNLKPLFAGNTENVRKAIDALRETGHIKPEDNEAAIILVVEQSLQKPVEPSTDTNGNAPAPVDDVDLDAHFATPAEDKRTEAPATSTSVSIPYINVDIRDLAFNDVVMLAENDRTARWLIKSISGTTTFKGKPGRKAVLVNIETQANQEYTFGGIGNTPRVAVVGGPKLDAAAKDETLIERIEGKVLWVRESDKVQS